MLILDVKFVNYILLHLFDNLNFDVFEGFLSVCSEVDTKGGLNIFKWWILPE